MKLGVTFLIVMWKCWSLLYATIFSHPDIIKHRYMLPQNKRVRYSEFSYSMDVRDIVIRRERAHELELKNAAIKESSEEEEMHQPVALLH